MKKAILFLVLIISALLIVGCDDNNFCGCETCRAYEVKCSANCSFKTTGKCTCPDCPDYDTSEPIVTSKVKVYSTGYKKQATNVNIDVQKPEIEGMSDLIVQQRINKDISDSILPYEDEIANLSEGFSYNDSDDMIKAKTYTYLVDYKTYLLDDYLSLVVQHDIRTGNSINSAQEPNKTDGVRSNKWKNTYVVDVVNNKELTYLDVCNITNCKGKIIEEINRQATEEKKIDILMTDKGLADIPDNQRFYIDDTTKKLIIYFEPGSIAKFSAGELLFEMPFKYDSSSKKFVE